MIRKTFQIVFRQAYINQIRPLAIQQYSVQVSPFYNTSVRYFAKKTGDTSKDKKDKEKAKVAEEFEGKELDDIKNEYSETLEGC